MNAAFRISARAVIEARARRQILSAVFICLQGGGAGAQRGKVSLAALAAHGEAAVAAGRVHAVDADTLCREIETKAAETETQIEVRRAPLASFLSPKPSPGSPPFASTMRQSSLQRRAAIKQEIGATTWREWALCLNRDRLTKMSLPASRQLFANKRKSDAVAESIQETLIDVINRFSSAGRVYRFQKCVRKDIPTSPHANDAS